MPFLLIFVDQKYQLNDFCNNFVTLKPIQDAPIKENKTITHSIRKDPIAIPNFAEAFPPLSCGGGRLKPIIGQAIREQNKLNNENISKSSPPKNLFKIG